MEMPGMAETGCWWYLNFADGGRFLGAAVVKGVSPDSALRRAADLGICPGAEVLACPLPREAEGTLPIDRLLSLAEISARRGQGREMPNKTKSCRVA